MEAPRYRSNAEALEASLLEAGYLSGERSRRYAAAIELARALASRMDKLESAGWLNEKGNPDTATAGQYLRAIEALKMCPASEKAEGARGAARPARGSLAEFREKGLRVVG